MSRGNQNGNRGARGGGARGGPRGQPGRGRGRGRGRGGRGRGVPAYDLSNDHDFIIQMYPDNSVSRGGYGGPGSRGRGIGSPSRGYDTPSRGYGGPGSRGRGIGSPSRGYDTPSRGYDTPSRGYDTPSRGYDTPRGRGRGRGDFDSPRDRGRGRGGPKLRPDAPLSRLLYEDRPLLRPIIFVRAVHHATLFQEEEELIQPVVEDVGEGEQSHVPTADRVARVFSGGNMPQMESENEEESLEEFDFNDLGKVREEVDAAAASQPRSLPAEIETVEEQFMGIFINKPPQEISADSPMSDVEALAPVDTEALSVGVGSTSVSPPLQETPSRPGAVPEEMFYVDINPTPVPLPSAPAAAPDPAPAELFYVDTVPAPISLPPGSAHSALARLDAYAAPAEDEEVIVYVAPHPRSGRAPSPTPPPPSPPSLSATSIVTGTAIVPSAAAPPLVDAGPAPAFDAVSFAFAPSPKKPKRQPPVFTVQGHSKARTKARAQARRVERRAAFGSFGARLSEARLRGEAADPRRDERRRGDSDVDWGDEDEDDEGAEGAGGMDVEDEGGMVVDVELDAGAMRLFARGMGQDGGRWVTMDDIADEQRMRNEDDDVNERAAGSSGSEDEDGGESSGEEDEEVDAIVAAEEELMVAEPRDLVNGEDASEEEDDSDDSDDDDQSPKTGFQARLERLRKKARERRPDDSLDMLDWSSDDGDEDDFPQTWADKDDDFASQIQAILDENGDILSARSRQGRRKLLSEVKNGEIVDFEGFAPAKRGKDRRNDLPADLQAAWDNDRAKKAENKRLRALARMEAAADPLAHKKGGKKGRKAMLAAARTDPTITVIPNRVIDMATLVQQIRRFVADVGGPATMSLPPTDKETRKNIHEMAIVFNLKSQSKGKGDGRYTTLTKTTRSGFGVNEAKVAKIARRGARGLGGAGFVGVADKGKGRSVVMPRHRDGDEVGKAAPKIGKSNIGFKMLAMMGWTEGQRIGVSAGGLHVPLTAVIKNTKLGLGALR
ncbi:hypothetical protein C8J57DRAFT_1483860 [Mycena rebaudengoi]|nr:hypothetical protein C8J57DRAFT_1483860 [Mycena rebaudengoi]